MDVPRSSVEDTLASLRRERAAGNVTIPYKEVVAEECDRVTDEARAVGAVNTFWTAVDGALVGDNTDVGGFSAALRELGVETRNARVAILGAGGGAAAVLRAMEGWQNARAIVYARTEKRASELVGRFRVPARVAKTPHDAVQHATLIVNATPVGLRDDEMLVQPDEIPRQCAVFDLAYRKDGTALVRAARARGLPATDGLGMLVEQGALAFERWFGVAPDRDAMWAAVRSA
jgi:shikimate dehydrogenase